MSDFVAHDPGPDWVKTNSVLDAELIQYGPNNGNARLFWKRRPPVVFPTEPETLFRAYFRSGDSYVYAVTTGGTYRAIDSGHVLQSFAFENIVEIKVLYRPTKEDE